MAFLVLGNIVVRLYVRVFISSPMSGRCIQKLHTTLHTEEGRRTLSDLL